MNQPLPEEPVTRVVGADDRIIESLLGAAAPDPGRLQQPGVLL